MLQHEASDDAAISIDCFDASLTEFMLWSRRNKQSYCCVTDACNDESSTSDTVNWLGRRETTACEHGSRHSNDPTKVYHTSALIQSLFMQHPITLLDITAKLIVRQPCNFHIISIWPQRKKRTTLLLLFPQFFFGFKQFHISLGTAGVGGWCYW